LTVVECWLTEGKEMNEKKMNHPAHPTDRTANWCSHGGWFTLAITIIKYVRTVQNDAEG
jgi:hypothetical protein